MLCQKNSCYEETKLTLLMNVYCSEEKENMKTKQTHKSVSYSISGAVTLTWASARFYTKKWSCHLDQLTRMHNYQHLVCANTCLLSPLKWMELTLLMCPLSSFFVVSRTFGASAMSPQMSCNVLSATFFCSSWKELRFCAISRKASQV